VNTSLLQAPPRISTALLHLQDVCYSQGSRQILENVSFDIEQGQVLTVIGPNGAGKTTLVKIAMGLLPASSGVVSLARGLRIGYMPQKLRIETTMPITVSRFLRLVPGATVQDIAAVLEEVGATSTMQSSLHDLSGGELQRVLLARALLLQPQLLVLDEPAQGVDLQGQADLYRLITRIRDEHHCAVLMISHDLHLVMSATDEVLCLNQHICCHGHPEQVSNDPAYLELFGKKGAEAMAIYMHHHNHRHDLQGVVVDENGKGRTQ
jgi:zinc transport system ATP-binding protein